MPTTTGITPGYYYFRVMANSRSFNRSQGRYSCWCDCGCLAGDIANVSFHSKEEEKKRSPPHSRAVYFGTTCTRSERKRGGNYSCDTISWRRATIREDTNGRYLRAEWWKKQIF